MSYPAARPEIATPAWSKTKRAMESPVPAEAKFEQKLGAQAITELQQADLVDINKRRPYGDTPALRQHPAVSSCSSCCLRLPPNNPNPLKLMHFLNSVSQTPSTPGAIGNASSLWQQGPGGKMQIWEPSTEQLEAEAGEVPDPNLHRRKNPLWHHNASLFSRFLGYHLPLSTPTQAKGVGTSVVATETKMLEAENVPTTPTKDAEEAIWRSDSQSMHKQGGVVFHQSGLGISTPQNARRSEVVCNRAE